MGRTDGLIVEVVVRILGSDMAELPRREGGVVIRQRQRPTNRARVFESKRTDTHIRLHSGRVKSDKRQLHGDTANTHLASKRRRCEVYRTKSIINDESAPETEFQLQKHKFMGLRAEMA